MKMFAFDRILFRYDVLNACRDCGQEKLGQHCLELALKNPYLEENWEKRFRRVFTTILPSGSTKPRSHATAKPIADTKPDDGTVYHYCSVQVQGTRRPYAYLTGGLPLKVGDWVELPFGKDDVPRHGQVKAVMDCTRMVAPWPPEQTKTVIRTIDAPAVTPTTEVAAPESQKRVEQPKKKTERVEIPVISAPETKTEESKAEAAGHCFKGKHSEEYMLISFSYYDYSISNSFGHNSTSDNSSDNGGSSIRDDYDNPEDLWEENQDWYEDEDEAWDEWYDG